MNTRYARVSPISPPISVMKNPHPIRSRYPILRTMLPGIRTAPTCMMRNDYLMNIMHVHGMLVLWIEFRFFYVEIDY